MNTSTSLGLAAAVAAAGLWIAGSARHGATAPLPPTPVATAATAAVSAPAIAPAVAAAPQITFPDGSQRPVLNGVTESVALQWPADASYSPVVATVRDGDTEWFRHRDGSWSTTLRLLDQATGNYVTMSPVYLPAVPKEKRLRGGGGN